MIKTESRWALAWFDMLLLWITLALWLAMFLIGTLVNSEPYRNRFAAFQGDVVETIMSGLLVIFTYTLTNVAFLCILAGVLGVLGSKAVLTSDTQAEQQANTDITSPKSSAVLRSFVVYLTLIAGVLILSDNPTEPTQIQYVRLAGLMSLVGFIVNYRPTLFGELLQRAGNMLAPSNPAPAVEGQDR